MFFICFFFKQKTAYEMRISDWSSDVCSSDLHASKAIGWGVDGLILLTAGAGGHTGHANAFAIVPQVRRMWDGAILLAGAISDGRSILAAQVLGADFCYKIGRASCRERGCQYG